MSDIPSIWLAAHVDATIQHHVLTRTLHEQLSHSHHEAPIPEVRASDGKATPKARGTVQS